jgi:hypothetical protein
MITTEGPLETKVVPPSKRCRRCGTDKPLSEFHRNRTAKDGLQRYCKPCNGGAGTSWRERNPGAHAAAQRRQRAANIEHARSYGRERYYLMRDARVPSKDAPCTDCGNTFPPAVMEWDHLPEFEKKFNLSLAWRYSPSDVAAELLKCELVCANCHRMRTHSEARKTVRRK